MTAATATPAMPKITYGIANIKSYEAEYDDKGNVASLIIDDKIQAKPSDRFWTSLCCQFSSYGLSPKLFKLFTHREVFDRLHERLPEHGGEMRYTVENHDGECSLLALSRPSKAYLPFDETYDLLARTGLGAPGYARGIIRTNHAPAHMADFTVGPDEFSHRYVTEIPIDGFSLPSMYLSLFRTVCSNGATAMSPAFRSSVPIGNDETNTVMALGRAIDSFNNEEGYAALRQRFESAANSWASIRECQKAYGIMAKLADAGSLTIDGLRPNVVRHPDGRIVEEDSPGHFWTHESTFRGHKGMLDDLCTRRSIARRVTEEGITMREKINRAYLQMSGDIVDLYKLTTVDSLTDKKQGQLPSKCTVFDLINLSTELSTHYAAGANSARKLDAFVGDLVSAEFDLEDSKKAKPQFTDWFMDVRNN